jgi:hypothetical protein
MPIVKTFTGMKGAPPSEAADSATIRSFSSHYLRLYLNTLNLITIDLRKKILQMTRDIGLNTADIFALSASYKILDWIRITFRIDRPMFQSPFEDHQQTGRNIQ